MSNLKEYKKLNSFNEFISKNFEKDTLLILEKINKSVKDQSNLKNLSLKQKKVLSHVIEDLFEKIAKKIKFKLSKHVIEELNRIDEKKCLCI